jgi:hypothetical protein
VNKGIYLISHRPPLPRVAKNVLAVRWVRTEKIQRKLDEVTMARIDRGIKIDAGWSSLTRLFSETAKHRSAELRFLHGVRWEDTPVFEEYRSLFARGNPVRGQKSLEDLVAYYENRMDRLFRQMQSEGLSKWVVYRSPSEELPWVATGPHHEPIFGSQGNHRLSIAKILGLQHFPVRVRLRLPTSS